MSALKIKILSASIVLVLILAFFSYDFVKHIIPYFFQPTKSAAKANINSPHPEMILQNLTVPWELVFLPDGDLLVTERPGRLRRHGKLNQSISVPGIAEIGEGGLLGMALDPDFINNHYLYLYRTTRKKGQLMNEIVRYTYKNNQLTHQSIILSNIPAARFHNGGRILFGPDDYLYVTTGDALFPSLAQDKQSLAGKVLRITKEGKPAPNNPFNSPVYSFGHRNPQGLAFDSHGQLWETEHGQSANDEVNLIESGENYGWPVIQGNEKKAGMKGPILTSGANETWAPGGIAISNDRIFFAGLRGQALYEAKLNPKTNSIESLIRHYPKLYGRIRHVVLAPDGYLYFLTSNQDGRGWPAKQDDKIFRIHPNALH